MELVACRGRWDCVGRHDPGDWGAERCRCGGAESRAAIFIGCAKGPDFAPRRAAPRAATRSLRIARRRWLDAQAGPDHQRKNTHRHGDVEQEVERRANRDERFAVAGFETLRKLAPAGTERVPSWVYLGSPSDFTFVVKYDNIPRCLSCGRSRGSKPLNKSGSSD